jgi:hypothetical protein
MNGFKELSFALIYSDGRFHVCNRFPSVTEGLFKIEMTFRYGRNGISSL